MVKDDVSPDVSVTRRDFIVGSVGATALPVVVNPAAASKRELSVMTRNLAIGVDLSVLEGIETLDELRQVAGQLFEDFRRYPFEPRAAAFAGEIEATRPAVVGIQEAMLVRTQRSGPGGLSWIPNASIVEVDFLEELRSALADLGLAYEVASSTVTTDIQVPAEIGGRLFDLRLTDRVAMLVHDDIDVRASIGGTFDATRHLPVSGFSLHRGYCLVDIEVDNGITTVATTHLESSDSATRRRQAEELVGMLPTECPVIVAGDFNSGPEVEPETYEYLTTYLGDAHRTLGSPGDGYTCCQAADLQNDESQLTWRIDGALYRGPLEPTAIERVGAAPADRVVVHDEAQTVRLWPSDHAGVVATFEFGDEHDHTRDGACLGEHVEEASAPDGRFTRGGIGVAMAGVGAASYLLKRRHTADSDR